MDCTHSLSKRWLPDPRWDRRSLQYHPHPYSLAPAVRAEAEEVAPQKQVQAPSSLRIRVERLAIVIHRSMPLHPQMQHRPPMQHHPL